MSVFQGRPLASLQPRLLKDGLNALKAVGELHGRREGRGAEAAEKKDRVTHMLRGGERG